jgi:hypothetical protein
MSEKKSSNNLTKQRAQGLVEFALILPVLLLIAFGILDLGRAFFVTIAIQNATREGARQAARDPNISDSDIIALVRAEAVGSGLDLGNDLSISVLRYGSGADTVIRVTASYNFYPLMGIIRAVPITLTRFTEMMDPFASGG